MAERFIRTIRGLLNRPAFEGENANWTDVLPTVTKQYTTRVHSSTKLTPIEGSVKENEGYVYQSLLENRKRVRQKYKIHDFVRTADTRRSFSKENTTNW